MDTDALLTLAEARAALIGDAASRSDAYPSIKTLRRAYKSEQLAVFQRVRGGRVMVWRSELMRWARVHQEAQRPREDTVPPTSTAPVLPKPRRLGAKLKTAGKAKPPTVLASQREREGVPPRLSLADLRAA